MGDAREVFPDARDTRRHRRRDQGRGAKVRKARKLQPEEIFVSRPSTSTSCSACATASSCSAPAGSGQVAGVEDARARADPPRHRRTAALAVATLNPKAVTSNDLYGYVHPVTKEPYDGIIAKIMRDFARRTGDGQTCPSGSYSTATSTPSGSSR